MSNADDCKIGFIGFGNMASAMADGWIASGTVPPANLYACASRYEALLERTDARGMNACQSAADLVDAVDVVVIAIKPHLIDEVLSPLAERLAAKPILSVAAGWDCARYEALLPGTRHISTVPNTPVSICEGVIACERTHTLRDDDYASVRALLDAFGSVVEVESRLLSVAGTVGGCGPAFIAMVIEALGDAAVKHGIPLGRRGGKARHPARGRLPHGEPDGGGHRQAPARDRSAPRRDERRRLLARRHHHQRRRRARAGRIAFGVHSSDRCYRGVTFFE